MASLSKRAAKKGCRLVPIESEGGAEAASPPADDVPAAAKTRGRPRKDAQAGESADAPARRRGRPRKEAQAEAA
jgi:hypothetical protein